MKPSLGKKVFFKKDLGVPMLGRPLVLPLGANALQAKWAVSLPGNRVSLTTGAAFYRACIAQKRTAPRSRALKLTN